MEPGANGMKLQELADRTGVPPRTIRLYITRGLVPGPDRVGRGATYNAGHEHRLQEIRRLQQEGLTLQQIAHRLAGEAEAAPLPPPQPWSRFDIAEDVQVLVKADAAPWRMRHIHAALSEMAAALSVSLHGDTAAVARLATEGDVPDRDLVLDVRARSARPLVFSEVDEDGRRSFAAVVPSSALSCSVPPTARKATRSL